jgi:hypothetical protein
LRYLGANPHPRVVGLKELSGKVNYFIGSNPRRWYTDIPTYARVEYRDVYPGVNLLYYGRQNRLEYDWVVRSGVSPRRIRVDVGGTLAAARNQAVRLDAHGNLVIATGSGEILQPRPVFYQWTPSGRRFVGGRYVLLGMHQVGFAAASYDAGKPLIIDPMLTYSSFLGGGGDEGGGGIAVDSGGNAYVTGYTSSGNFPLKSAVQSTYGGGALDAFVTKLNAAGTGLVYSTYLGGDGTDVGRGIAVDSKGNAYVAGYTNSSNFPTVAALQKKLGAGICNFGSGNTACRDAFVAKLNTAGNALLYSTYLGGDADDVANGIAVDGQGSAYVVGQTQSHDFPIVGAVQASLAGGTCMYAYGMLPCFDAFVAKLNAAGSALVYSTYLGGNGDDAGTAIAVDAAGNAYIAGYTNSGNFPVIHPLQSSIGGGTCTYATGALPCYDAFVAKLNPAGSQLLYSTYLGGEGDDSANGIAVDSAGNAYVTGQTNSSKFPTVNAVQPTLGGGICGGAALAAPCHDAFVTKIDAAGNGLIYSTYLGGSGDDAGLGIAVDSAGNASVTGRTESTNFPTFNALQSTFGGGTDDVFIARLQSGGTLLYSTYLGGNALDEGFSVAVDGADNAYVTGRTSSTDFPTAAALQPALGGRTDAFVAKLHDMPAPAPSSTPLSTPIPEGTPTVTPVGTETATPLPTQTGTRTPIPTQATVTEVSVISVKIEKVGTGPDWDLARPSRLHANARAPVRLSIYYTVTNAGPNVPVVAQWTVRKNRQSVLSRKISHALGAATRGLFWEHIQFRLGARGTYVYTGRVTVRGQSDAGITKIVARQKKRGKL